ncbi:MAG: outer membrane lipid asymmetry maintenance protein MlaD [Succinivibrio sp.]|nr:outer membrane lipid asymmetry maintenance protein MlaD [Succinivibrio sp.]
MKYVKTEIMVGMFMLAGIVAAVVLCLKVAGLVMSEDSSTYTVMARFDNIGSLKIRAPIKIGGVLIGRVEKIDLDKDTLTPVVHMAIESRFNTISSESKASILTAGLIGEQYIGITPGFYDEDLGTTYLKQGDTLKDTGSAMVLEDLISKFAFGAKE